MFTRCPLPNHCPLMLQNFFVLQKEMPQQFKEKVHPLSTSFDPAHDTTGVLKEYAEKSAADPKDWSFATGTPGKIKSVATLFGLTYEMRGGSSPADATHHDVLILLTG
jgi:protein SCO1/2